MCCEGCRIVCSWLWLPSQWDLLDPLPDLVELIIVELIIVELMIVELILVEMIIIVELSIVELIIVEWIIVVISESVQKQLQPKVMYLSASNQDAASNSSNQDAHLSSSNQGARLSASNEGTNYATRILPHNDQKHRSVSCSHKLQRGITHKSPPCPSLSRAAMVKTFKASQTASARYDGLLQQAKKRSKYACDNTNKLKVI